MPEFSAIERAGAGDWLRISAPAARFILQGGAVARAAAGDAFKVTLSDSPCRANALAGRAALWLGPEEHLLLASADERQAIGSDLATALKGLAHSLVDVSSRQIALQLTGPRASAILNAGCPLDLDPAEFPPGMCTRTLFGKVEVVLWRKAAGEYHLEVWRSFRDYVLGLLLDAGRSEIGDRTNEGEAHAYHSAG